MFFYGRVLPKPLSERKSRIQILELHHAALAFFSATVFRAAALLGCHSERHDASGGGYGLDTPAWLDGLPSMGRPAGRRLLGGDRLQKCTVDFNPFPGQLFFFFVRFADFIQALGLGIATPSAPPVSL